MSHTHELLLRGKPRLPLGQRAATAALVAILGAALTFFVALFAAVIVMLVFGLASGSRPDMRLAYRTIAIPAALIALPAMFALAMWWQERTSGDQKIR